MKSAWNEILRRVLNPRGVCILGIALVLLVIETSSLQATGSNANPEVTFSPIGSTYRTSSNTSGCPAGFAAKFTFTALLTNKPTSPPIPDLSVRVAILTNGNVLLDPQTNALLGGVGAVMTVRKVGQYADGVLSPQESVEVPFVLCLKVQQAFQFFVDVYGVVAKLVSVNLTGTAAGTTGALISADGRYVAFFSDSDSLVPNDHNGLIDVFLRDMQTGITTLVSVNQSGTSGSGNSFGVDSNTSRPTFAISGNGRFVAFGSEASDLVLNDNNGLPDVFIRDTQSGVTTLLPRGGCHTWPANLPADPHFNADGRFLTFVSVACDDEYSGGEFDQDLDDVFVRDMLTGTTSVASQPLIHQFHPLGYLGYSAKPSISADGRFVLFFAVSIFSRPPGLWTGIFLYDVQMGTTTTVADYRLGSFDDYRNNFFSALPQMSEDARFIVLPSQDGNNVLIRDRQLGTTALVSVNRFGTGPGNGPSDGGYPLISPNGRFVAFTSAASDLVDNDTNGGWDWFVRDLEMGRTTLIPRPHNVLASPFGQGISSLSNDGLVAYNFNGVLYVWSLQTGVTTPIASGSGIIFSGNGRYILLTSSADDLTPNDTNGKTDVFVRPSPK